MLHPESHAVFPLPRSVHHHQDRYVAVPAIYSCTNHANASCLQSFQTGLKLTAPKPGPVLRARGGFPILLVPMLEGLAGEYRLSITSAHIRVEARDGAGFQYAGSTLGYLWVKYREDLPELKIDDSPAFARRGVMLDISRNKVPTMRTLLELVDQLAAWKINHLQLYTEHTFAYARHPDVWRDCSPMTADEYRTLDARCRMVNIELSANQNSFGHLHRWLKLPAYQELAESPDGYMTPWGEQRTGPFSLNPLHPGSLKLLAGLYDELLPAFTSEWVNIGGDETFDLGQGASKAMCEQIGKGRVYLNFLRQIKQLVEARGKRMMFWADIVLNHPELIPELPVDPIALVWGYEADHPFAEQCRALANSRIPFWVCPGTSTWNSIAGRFDNARDNIDAAARAGREHGASGLMITEWGDNGHWQTQPFSRLALGMGASAAWKGYAPTEGELSRLLPGAPVIIELGRVYGDAGFPLHNTSPVFSLIRYRDPDKILAQWTTDNLQRARHHIETASAGLSVHPMVNPLWSAEIQLAADMLDHALRRGIWLKSGRPASDTPALATHMEAIIAELSRTWLLRNRPGGLEESLVPLRNRLDEYRSPT